MNKPSVNHIYTTGLIVIFLMIYLLLPTKNSSIDAYNYAANIKWDHDLFFPHHLLYNYFQHVIFKLLNFLGLYPDVLSMMKAVNGIFAASSLLIFSLIIKQIRPDEKDIFNQSAWILLAGSTFGFMRYATENETYIIPIFWSLLATYFFLLQLQTETKKYLLYSGIFSSISCLFHQIHIFWYLGMALTILVYKKNKYNTLVLLLPSIIIIITYYLAFIHDHFEFIHAKNLWQFALYDYYFGGANTNLGLNNFVLGIISFIRNFVQLHGYIPVILKKIPISFAVLVPLFYLVYQLANAFIKNKPKLISHGLFTKSILIIFFLQLTFAFFSEGNAEFMVMLPMLLFLMVYDSFKIHSKIILHLALIMLIWNISFGLIPSHFIDFQKQSKILDFMNKQKRASFILSDDVLIQNILYYESGIGWNTNIYKSPSALKSWNKSPVLLSNKIDSCRSANINVYTDCIDEPSVMSRKIYLQNDENDLFFEDYLIQKSDSINTFYGIKYFYKILYDK